MAKIFRTETLSVNGDNIRLASSANDQFEFTDETGAVIMSRATITSDVSSLMFIDEGVHSDVSSLKKVDDDETANRSSDVSSLMVDEDGIHSDISSLQLLDDDQDSDISSLSAKISTNDVVAKSASLSTGESYKEVAFGVTFATNPTVVGSLRSSAAADPIIGLQISGSVATDKVSFVFSDEIPTENYTLELLASV